MLFWSLTILLTVIALVVVLKPLLSAKSGTVDVDEDRLRVSVYKQNLLELEKESERGQLNQEQFANVKHELELTMLRELEESRTDSASTNPVSGTGRSVIMAASSAIFIVVLSVSLYGLLGNPQLNALQKLVRSLDRDDEDKATSVESMTVALQEHLKKNPGDANGWMLLANAYTSLEDHAQAVTAFEQLYQLAGDAPSVLLGYANALVMANKGRFSGLPAELLQRVIAIEPTNYTALFFSGLASEESGDYRRANEYYARLLPALQNNPELSHTVSQLIARNELLIAGKDAATDGSVADEPQHSSNAGSIQLHVSVAADLAGDYAAEDTLFIYAQAIEGPPMPLAVVRKQAGDLPLDIVLDDSMAMMPALRLSGFDQVKVQARISESGNAQPNPGDLVGEITGVEVAATEAVNLIIDSVVR